MRLWRTTWHENEVQKQYRWAGQPVIQATLDGDCLEVGTYSVTTQIPRRRLTRAGIRYHLLSHPETGRTHSSVCNRPAAQQSPPLRRRHANPGGTWLWIGCASGYCPGLLVDCFAERKSPEADTDVWYHHSRAAELARVVALRRLHSYSYGEHGSVLEAGVRDSGRSVGDRGGQCATRQDGSRAQDRREGRGMDCGLAMPRATAL